MNGLELSRGYFFERALPLLRRYMPDISQRCAAGLCSGGLDAGCGSEVFGYDDELSRDHNWGPRFFLFLTEQEYERHAPAVRKLFLEKLPVEYMGYSIRPTTAQATHFHITTPQRNALSALAIAKVPVTDEEWYTVPECRLWEYTAGEIYYDPLEMVTAYKARYVRLPQNVWLKRLAGAFFMLHTAGNAARCAARGEWGACRAYADMAVASAQRAALLLNGRYPPHVKWRARAVRELPSAPPEWQAAMERICRELPSNAESLRTALNAVLCPVGDMANGSGLIPPVPLHIRNDFLDFPCYEFSKAFESKINGELSGRPLAVALDQMSEGFQPHTSHALLAHWRAGRPGIAEFI